MSSATTVTSPGLLSIDLDAVQRNYRLLSQAAAPATCGAVVKADAYGLGLAQVAPSLRAAGCEHFFVANLAEGRQLGKLLAGAQIFVLAGPEPGEESSLRDAGLIPVLNSLAQIERWVEATGRRRLRVAIHIDTGMSRLGMDVREVGELAGKRGLLDVLEIEYVLTHLACADEPEHPLNEAQLTRFDRLRASLPAAKTCVGNSAAVFSGARYCGDLARAGIALYGGNPFLDKPNPMQPVVRLYSPILQVREVIEPVTVGYGATHVAEPPARLATVGAGYADGYPRALGNLAHAFLGGVSVPVVGRVSMDMLTVDVSAVPASQTSPGAMVELLGDHVPLDELANAAGTISYEILTRLGSRWIRRYHGDTAGS
jgi:alanine racemase